MNEIITVIEDDPHISELIEFNLKKEGYETYIFDNANDALIFLGGSKPDLIILDLMLPGIQGEDFVKFVKSKDDLKEIPILISTAKTDDELFVKLLESGADDFIVKPFSVKVLVAKVKAILRRAFDQSNNTISLSGIELNPESFEVYVDGKQIELTKTEFLILELLLRKPNKVLSREYILNHVWGGDVDVGDRTVDVHLSKLRKKLGNKGNLIKSIPRIGYKLKAQQ